MSRIKQYLVVNKAFLIVVLIIVSWFYWFQLRSSQASKECSKVARGFGSIGTSAQSKKVDFDLCMKSKGIN